MATMKNELLNKVITTFLAILVALGGWTLSRTYELSYSQATNNEKIVKLEDTVAMLLEKDKEMRDQHARLFELLEFSGGRSDRHHKMPKGYY